MTTQTSGRTLVKELFIAAPPERVYRALTEKADLERWFVTQAQVGDAPGGPFDLTWLPHQRSKGEIREMDPPHRFVFAWDLDTGGQATTCAFDLVSQDGGTLLRLTQTGFGDGDDWDRIYDDNSGGWDIELVNLKRWLEDGVRKSDWGE